MLFDIFEFGKKGCGVCLLYFLENGAKPNPKDKIGETHL